MKKSINYLNLYFQVHQPRRLRSFSFFDFGSGASYFDDELNEEIFRKISHQCYLPMNYMLLRLIQKYPQIRLTFSITGTTLDQMEQFSPAVLETFRMLAATGSVDFMAETYNHSLSFLASKESFIDQVARHREKMKSVFGIEPRVFRNTELMYSNELGKWIAKMGLRGIFVDGVDHILHGRSPHHLYRHPDAAGLKLLLRDYRAGDDIAFRFSDIHWSGWPLTPERFLASIKDSKDGALINLGLDYETFGEHQREQSGIFKFMEGTLAQIATSHDFRMVTASEALEIEDAPNDIFSAPQPISWADKERNLSAWLGNDMQRDAFDSLYRLDRTVRRLNVPEFNAIWDQLQTSDHFYYMSTKRDDDGNIHGYFSHYPSPYEAFVNYMNVLSDFSRRLDGVRRERLIAREMVSER